MDSSPSKKEDNDSKEQPEPFATHLAQDESDVHNTEPSLDDQTIAEERQRRESEDVHRFEGQDPHERERYQDLFKDGHRSMEAKLNAADAAEALPHRGFTPGDL